MKYEGLELLTWGCDVSRVRAPPAPASGASAIGTPRRIRARAAAAHSPPAQLNKHFTSTTYKNTIKTGSSRVNLSNVSCFFFSFTLIIPLDAKGKWKAKLETNILWIFSLDSRQEKYVENILLSTKGAFYYPIPWRHWPNVETRKKTSNVNYFKHFLILPNMVEIP